MTVIDFEKDLQNVECFRVRMLIYYIGFWYENETKQAEKNNLYNIYSYLVYNKPEIQDLFYDENNYNNILKILDIYKEDEDDIQGAALLYDIKTTLIEKKI